MNIDEYNNRLNNVISDLQTGAHGQVMVRMAMTALTLLRQRVQQKGENAEGAKFRPYSTKAMLIGCKSLPQDKCNALFGSKEKRKAMEWRTVKGHRLAILPGGYRQYRQIYGAQVNHVDFMLSGRMWANINVISNNSQHQQGVAVIGAKNDEEKKKLAGNTKSRGDILDLSPKEIDELKKQYNLDVLQIFKNNGLG